MTTTLPAASPTPMATSPETRPRSGRRRRWPWVLALLTVVAVLGSSVPRGRLVAAFNALLGRPISSSTASTGDAHDHAHGEPADPDVIEPSATARKSLDLKFIKVARGDYQRAVSIPAVLSERPGQSEVEVSAPLTGIVTKVYIVQGESVAPGAPLFDLRITHADLLDAQTEFLRSLESLDVINREVARLKKLSDQGTVPSQRLLQMEYDQEKMLAEVKVERQALILHGLLPTQVETIEKDRTLLPQLTVTVPNSSDAPPRADGIPTLVAEYVHVTPGAFVQAGDRLCGLSDHAELYIEGKAFEQDLDRLSQAIASGTKLSATFDHDEAGRETLKGLELLFVSNRVDQKSRTVDFYIRLPNEPTITRELSGSHRFVDWKYRPGRRLHVRVPVETFTDRYVLPAQACVDEGIESYVFVRDGFKFRKRRVNVSYRDQEMVVLDDGSDLKVGEVVVTRGATPLHLALKLQASGGADAGHGHHH
jgi:cobalt-zinc-cadmium efflux system membrane fusion protein